MLARAGLTAAAILSIAFFSSCGEDGVTNTSPRYSRSTPENLVDALAYSIKHMDIDVYDECLHDEYLFIFDSFAARFVGLPEDEPWWGKADDVNAMSNVFNNPAVVRIECAIEVDTGPWPTDDGFGYRLYPDMMFTTVRSGDWEGYTLPIQDSWFYVEIVADPDARGEYVFREIEEAWRDPWQAGSAPGPGAMSYSSTFGMVKAMFGQ